MNKVSLPQGHVALGANLATSTRTPIETLSRALELIVRESVEIVRRSAWYQTPAFPAGSGPDFVNAVVAIRSALPPDTVLAALHTVEAELGRVRDHRWGARVCDLDLISFGEDVLPSEADFLKWQDLPLDLQMSRTPDQMILPHPRLQDRAFVLVPMCEISPQWQHPVTGLTTQQMVDALPVEDRKYVRVMT